MLRKLTLLTSMFLVVAIALTGHSLAIAPEQEPGVIELSDYCGFECNSPRYAVFHRHFPTLPDYPELPTPVYPPAPGRSLGSDAAPRPPANEARALSLTPKGAMGAGAAFFDSSTASSRSARVRSAAIRYELVRVSSELGL